MRKAVAVSPAVRAIGNRDAASILETLRKVAVQENAQYPQYAGFFDKHGLARVVSTKGLRPRGRAAWPVGTLAIGKLEVDSDSGEMNAVLYRAGYGNCALHGYNVEWVIRPTQ